MGGLMQIVAYGAQDIYLTASPNVTWYKLKYSTRTNFSTPSLGNPPKYLIFMNGELTETERYPSYTYTRHTSFNMEDIEKQFITSFNMIVICDRERDELENFNIYDFDWQN